MPEQYYRDWLKVAAAEAYHLTLLSDHRQTLGYAYGDFPAHNGNVVRWLNDGSRAVNALDDKASNAGSPVEPCLHRLASFQSL